MFRTTFPTKLEEESNNFQVAIKMSRLFDINRTIDAKSYEGLLRRYIRPSIGDRVLSAVTPLDLQNAYQR